MTTNVWMNAVTKGMFQTEYNGHIQQALSVILVRLNKMTFKQQLTSDEKLRFP